MTGFLKHFFKVCPKSGRIVKIRLSAWWAAFAFPVIGVAALLWVLIRVIPKPSRAAYPCQKVAMPVAAGFFAWIVGIAGTFVFYRKAREFIRTRRYLLMVIAVSAFVLCGLWSNLGDLYSFTLRTGANQPRGVARGIYPGRVVWAFDTNATSWTYGTGRWFQDAYNDQTAVDAMVMQSICRLSGTANVSAAWDALFRSFNRKKGLGDRGYQAGDKIAIKINMNNDVAAANPYADGWSINASPQLTLALLKSLINGAGIPQTDISVAEPSRAVKDCIFTTCTNLFPNVRYVDQFGVNGRTMTAYVSNRIPFSKYSGRNIKHIAACFVEAAYVINVAVMKGHVDQGVTLCGKNWFGATGISWYYQWNTNEKYGFSAPANGGDAYHRFVDFMGHKDLGEKTVLFMLDALYAHNAVSSPPKYKWQMTPFSNDWPSSIFVSQDGVAIDSVGIDFLTSEFPAMPDLNYCDQYLLEAALADNPPSGTFYDPEKDGTRLASLGVFEHWNNPLGKMYSRNLSADGIGIELVRTFQKPPSVSITSPAGGTRLSAPGTCMIHVNAADSDGLVLKVELYTNGIRAGEDRTGIDGWAYSLSGLAAENYSVTAKAYDSDGASTESSAVSFSVDDAPTGLPDLLIYRMSMNPPDPGPGTNVTFSAVVSNAGAAATPYTNIGVIFKIDGANLSYDAPKMSLASGAAALITGINKLPPSAVNAWTAAAGSHTVSALADDVNRVNESDNNNNSAMMQFTVSAAVNSPPVISISAPVSGASFPVPAVLTLRAEASDIGGAVTRVIFFTNGVKAGEDTAAPYDHVLTLAAAGTYVLTATAEDNAGATADSAAVVVTAAAPQPARPDLIVSSISLNPPNPGPGTNVTFSAVVSNAGTAATPYTNVGVIFKIDGANLSYDAPKMSLASGAAALITGINKLPPSASPAWAAAAGTHTVLAHVDDVNRIIERDENNNTNEMQYTVTAAATDNKIFIEAESGVMTLPMRVFTDDPSASGGSYVMTPAVNNSLGAAPAAGVISYTFMIPETGLYRVAGLVKAPNGADDSFWVKMGDDAWIPWNNIYGMIPAEKTGMWNWVDVFNYAANSAVMEYQLTAGRSYILRFAYREDAAKLDRICIRKSTEPVPQTMPLETPAALLSGVKPNSLTAVHAIPEITGATATMNPADKTLRIQYSINTRGAGYYELTYEKSESDKRSWQPISPSALRGGLFSLSDPAGWNEWAVSGLSEMKTCSLRITATADQGASTPFIIDGISPGNFAAAWADGGNTFAINNPYRGEEDGIVFVNLPVNSTVKIYTVTGRLLSVLSPGNYRSGRIAWNAADTAGRRVPPGVYFCRITSPAGGKTQKVVILR